MNEDIAKLAAEGNLAASAEPHNGTAVESFATQAFPCPHCGQMLGPGVRVCAACRQAIDPAQIRLPVPQPQAPVATTVAQRAPEKPQNTPFPWAIFFAVLLGMVLLSAATEAKFGMTTTAYGFGLVQLLTSLWVVFDAHRKGIPQPLQWGVGTMLLWVIVFPWYLARRRQPKTACPFVESGARALLRIVLLFILINIVGMLFFGSILNSLPK